MPASTLSTVNIFVAVLVRNELFLNGLYRVLVKVCGPALVPLAAKNGVTSGLLHIGGVHAGCALAGVCWLALDLLRMLPKATEDAHGVPLLLLAGAIFALLAAMCATALPAVRSRNHDLFEHVHRFAGWSALPLLWAYVLLGTASSSPHVPEGTLSFQAAAASVALWLTVLITLLILSPWLTVRRVKVEAEVPSKAVVAVTIPGGTEAGMFGRVSRRALSDWHAFALVSEGRTAASHTMVISGVGDFTKGLIAAPPAELYVRKLKFPGLPYCVRMYRRSVIIATGAGIAPFVPLLTELPPENHRVIWIGRSFPEYFGAGFCDKVLLWPNLVLVDTTAGGRPDMTSLAAAHYRSFGAEAVFVGSNPEGTKRTVSGCRALGIPAFGPSWDS